MSYGGRTTRHRLYNYTPAAYAATHQGQYQQSFRASNYTPSQQQQEEESSAIIPKPINVPGLHEQDQNFITKTTTLNRGNPYVYQTIAGTGKHGASVKKRVEMGFASGIREEAEYALKTLSEFSYSDPAPFAFKENPNVLASLVSYLDCDKIVSCYESEELAKQVVNDDFQLTLDAALALRNFSQVIENSAVMSLHTRLREVLLKILNSTYEQVYTIGEDDYEASVELLAYAVDIVESISSYLSLAPKDDPLFLSLLKLLRSTEDRYTVVSILRSLSRLLVRTTSDAPSAADDVSEDVLDQITSYLLASSPLAIPDAGNNELLLASIDFIYQYCLPGGSRIDSLLASERRASMIRSVLPSLLTHGITDIPTEFSDRFTSKRFLKLVKRVATVVPEAAPKLNAALSESIDELEEPERASSWMRSCYEPSETDEVTQISLWKSYEAQFSNVSKSSGHTSKKLLPAVDFIKNVSNAFPHSSAKVINLEGGQKRFVISGIRPRRFAVPLQVGKEAASKTPEPLDDEGAESDPEEQPVISGLSAAEQEEFKLLNYGENVKIELSEINTSSALLINCLVKTEVGNKLFEGKRDTILNKVFILPALFSHVYDTLKYLDY